MIRPYQSNKEFIEAAGIAEQDAFIAVAIRRIVGKMLEIPARELVAELTFEAMMRRVNIYTDWDVGVFAMELEEYFKIDITPEMWEKGEEIAQSAGYPNWFYTPDNDNEYLDFLWKSSISVPPTKKITFGEWVHLGIETFSAFRNQLIPPADWTGIETSDLESDTVAKKCPGHYVAHFIIFAAIIVVIISLLIQFLSDG
ncbi:MAG: hypothetical protein LBC02_14780 [Planctomycetaceae bacterium]|jgi:hypothetical protein|nr:hypothetical protein [Planctomycetaceae bacterium]